MNRDEENAGKSRTVPTGMSVADAIARRVSCRAYKAEPVPKAHVLQILEAARLAPSACNQQPWRFAVVRDPGLRRRIVEEGFLPGIKMTWAIAAPVHVVVGMETSFLTHRLAASVSGVDYPWVDIGIAGEHLVLAATELGLATCWIGWIKPRTIARLVGWPRSVKPVVVITVGYPSEVEPGSSRRAGANHWTKSCAGFEDFQVTKSEIICQADGAFRRLCSR
jgi:nitroreductase